LSHVLGTELEQSGQFETRSEGSPVEEILLSRDHGCAEAMTSLKKEACSVSVFVTMASTVASSLDCEFLRTNNLLRIFAKLFQRADAAELSSKREEPKKLQELTICKKEDCRPGEAKAESNSCSGTRFTSYNGKRILMMPNSAGSAAATVAAERGLSFAMLGGGVDDFSNSEKVIFTPGFHTRLQYFGYEPRIVMHLWTSESSDSGEEDGDGDGADGAAALSPRTWACIDRPQGNLIDPALRRKIFNGTLPAESDPAPLHWMDAAKSRVTGDLISEVSAVAFRTPEDARQKPVPMGTVTMTVNMTYAGEVLSRLRLSPNFYSIVADAGGQVVAMSQGARDIVFSAGFSEEELRNPSGQPPCGAKRRTDCWWAPPAPLSLKNATDPKFSGIDFESILATVFNASMESQHLCSMGVRTRTLHVPKGGDHLAVFCRLMANPEWAIFLLAPLEELQTAATFSVDKENITKDNVGKNEDHDGKDTITLHNTGRVALPFQVTVSAGKGDNSSCMTVSLSNGTLAPNQTTKLLLNFDLDTFGYGTSSGWIIVHPDTSDDRGACFRKSSWTRFSLTRPKPRGFLKEAIIRNGIPLSAALMLALAMVLYRVVSSLLNSYYGKLAKERSTIEKALSATQEVSFPMVLLQVPIFKELGKFVAFENTLQRSTWLHTIQEIDDFLQKALNKVIFMSHQWTAFAEPDHTGKQYEQMVMAVEEVMKKWKWQESTTYVWLDYSSIPQRHRPSQTAAINSLTVYAAKVSAFVVVAPPVKHKDLEDECNKDTYQCRAWCRAEQLSHLLAQAGDNMFLAESGQLTPLDEVWLQKSIQVFGEDSQLTCCRRKHEGMDMCDQERLVVPMLGLWAQLCRTVKAGGANENLRKIHKDLSTLEAGVPRIKRIFPETFMHETENGHEERALFGNLVERLQDTLNQEQPASEKDKEKRNFKALATATAAAASLARRPDTLGVPASDEASGRRLSQVLSPPPE